VPASTIYKSCLDALSTYVSDPWRWPRESDLIVDLVANLRPGLGNERVRAALTGPGFDRELVDGEPEASRTVPRIRTEARVIRAGAAGAASVEAPSEAEEAQDESTGKRQLHKDRFDIAIYRDQPIDLVFHPNGARDVVVAVHERDLAALVEVKLYPELYWINRSSRQECPWLSDLIKLSTFVPTGVRAILLVETSLPLASIGVKYRGRKDKDALIPSTPSGRPPWPLPDGAFSARTTRPEGPVAVQFDPCTSCEPGGLYLFALALKASSAWKPTVAAGLLPDQDVAARCWRATVAV